MVVVVEPTDIDVMDELESVLGGAVLVALGTLFTILLDIGARAIFARAYQPSAYGIFSLSYTVLLVLSMVAALGLRNGLPRQIAVDEAEKVETNSAGSQILWALLLAGIASSFLGVILAHFNWTVAIHLFGDESYARPIRLVALAIPLFALIRVISAVFRGYSRPHERVVFQDLMRNVTLLLLLGFVIAFGYDHETAIATLPVSLGFTTVVYFAHLYRDNPGGFRDNVISRLYALDTPVSLIRFSYPLMLSTLLIQLMTWMDILMLGYFASSRTVGL